MKQLCLSDQIFSLSSDWDVVGANLVSPRNNPEYQNQIVSLDNVNFYKKSVVLVNCIILIF